MFRKKLKIRNVIIIILAVFLVINTLLAGFFGLKVMMLKKSGVGPASERAKFSLNVNLDGALDGIVSEIGDFASEMAEDISSGSFSGIDVSGLAESIVYSDSLINILVSVAYPMLYDTLVNLDMLTFAENVHLYPTGSSLANLLGDNPFTAVDTDGVRKPLNDVLRAADANWGYFDSEVEWTAADGSAKRTTIWNSVVWGVTGKDNFYDIAARAVSGLMGVFEICLQNKSIVVNINVADFLLGIDSVNIGMDAATIYNPSPASGYECCLVKLYNILGLTPGEYPDPSEFVGYSEEKDILRAMIEPLMTAVSNLSNDPVQGLCDMLVNLAVNLDSGELKAGIKTLTMYADFNKLAASLMGYENGELFNLGGAIIDMAGSLGLNLSSSLSTLIDDIVQAIADDETVDMPVFDTDYLLSKSSSTNFSNGFTHYNADPEATIAYLTDYILGEDVAIANILINLTPLAGTPEGDRLIAEIKNAAEPLSEIIKILVPELLDLLGGKA